MEKQIYQIKTKGIYHINEDIDSDLDIQGDDITVLGFCHEVRGVLHVKGNRINVTDVIVKPDVLYSSDKPCRFCGRQGSVVGKACVIVHDSKQVEFNHVIPIHAEITVPYTVEDCTNVEIIRPIHQ
jgi:hypothetical protein